MGGGSVIQPEECASALTESPVPGPISPESNGSPPSSMVVYWEAQTAHFGAMPSWVVGKS
jgi:hypothetical protein